MGFPNSVQADPGSPPQAGVILRVSAGVPDPQGVLPRLASSRECVSTRSASAWMSATSSR